MMSGGGSYSSSHGFSTRVITAGALSDLAQLNWKGRVKSREKA